MAAVLAAHRSGDLIALRTSGTSGTPRAVVRTTESWFCSFPHVSDLLQLGPDSRLWVPGPLSATMNLFAAVHATSVGAEIASTLGGATHAVLTPAVLRRALAVGTDLAGAHVLVAGDRLPQRLHDAATAAGAGAVSHYYGAAELSFVAWGAHEDDLHAFPGVDLSCRDQVVWVRSPYLCEGYVGPDGPLLVGPDGYATVGDRGVLQAGRLRVLGRGGDTVVTAGATVLVADVEQALRPAVRSGDLAVLGVPHPDLGEVLCAVVTDPDTAKAARSLARVALSPAQRPRRWFATDTLPLTAAGKVDRLRLRAMLVPPAGDARRLG